MLDVFLNETVLWLFGTAVLFTFVGRYMSFKADVDDVVAATIDSLIEEGYLKTRGSGKQIEILKYNEE